MADNKMLIDATHPEETRVVVLRGGRVEEFDYESAARKLLRGNIYLAKVTRVEPALQAAFIDYGGNRHGFLAFTEIHPDYYQIPMADRLALIEEDAAAAVEAEQQSDDDDTYANETDSGSADPADGEPDTTAGHDEPRADNDDDQVDTAGAGEDDNGDGRETEATGEDTATVIQEAALADPTLSEPAPHDTEESDDNDDSSQNADEPGEPGSSEDTTEGNADTPASADSENDNGAPIDIGLVEDERVEEVGPTSETADAEPVEEVGTEDALEEVPYRPRRSRRSYKIQEVIKRRQILLIQVVKEERGNKGAALTTYLSLAGRYTVLMPNTARGGGVSRKISSPVDRKRMKAIASELEVPEGMGLIIRTAGSSRTKQEIRRDFDYLLRLWESVRELTLESTAPSLVYEEGNLIKRSIRDLYNKDIGEIVVAGNVAHKEAKGFMRMLMPSHTRNVTLYKAPEPVFTKFKIEGQLNAMFSPQVSLKSGGYLVINQTEALVAIDVNSGRSTREFSIEETALHTNLEASDEVARQLKLRDLAGLIVIDFIDMDEKRNNRAVERRMKEALRDDRARIQVGHISHFGLMEMSRQRMRTGVLEGSTSQCQQCQGTGIIRSTESVALAVLRGLEDAVMAGARTRLIASTTPDVALYILNSKREFIDAMEARMGHAISVQISDKMVGANFKIEKGPAEPRASSGRAARSVINMDSAFANENSADSAAEPAEGDAGSEPSTGQDEQPRRRRRRRRPARAGEDTRSQRGSDPTSENATDGEVLDSSSSSTDTARESEPGQDDNATDEDRPRRSRRRGRRGGRRNRERREAKTGTTEQNTDNGQPEGEAGQTNNGEHDSVAIEISADDHPPTQPPLNSDIPGDGEQPSFDTPVDSQPAADEAPADDDGAPKAARPPRRRRTPARTRRSPATQHDDAPTTGQAASDTIEPGPVTLDDTDASTPDAAPSSRRSETKQPPPAIEITSVRVGHAPEGDADDTPEVPPQQTDPKKPTRTGWWQRRLLGED